MDESGYSQFCPLAMAAEVVCTRWTPLVLRELLCGSRRFNDLRKGVPRMSPTLLSKRLKELEEAGIIQQVKDPRTGAGEYQLTESGEDLRPIIISLGFWGQRWVSPDLSLRNLDPTLLMWDMRRSVNPALLPRERVTVKFVYPELPEDRRSYWLVFEPGKDIDVCQVDPGHDVGLYVTTSLRSMTMVWMGLTSIAEEIDAGAIDIVGDRHLARTIQQWLGLSHFAKEAPRRPFGARSAGVAS